MNGPKDQSNSTVSSTLFLSEDIRYKQGGIYEHGDEVDIPTKKKKTTLVLPFTPRAVVLKQPKIPSKKLVSALNHSKNNDNNNNNSSSQYPQPRRGPRKDRDPKYTLKQLPQLDDLLDTLEALPVLHQDAPQFLASKDIRDAQDIESVDQSWRWEFTGRAIDDRSVWQDGRDHRHIDLYGRWISNEIFPIQEGQELAIHSHRTLAADEYPVLPMYEMDREGGLIMAPKIRLPASMDINAFLNSKTGRGRILLGIADDRSIKGLYLTPAQRCHVGQNLDDLLRRRYSPPVAKECYRVEFHPLFDGEVDGNNERR